jgi:uncharacterized protein
MFGVFNPSLMFVLGGAVITTISTFYFIMRRSEPVLADQFRLPISQQIDRPLVIGAALFGIGWGLAGYCPGPALLGAAAGVDTAIIFLAAMLAGAWVQSFTSKTKL